MTDYSKHPLYRTGIVDGYTSALEQVSTYSVKLLEASKSKGDEFEVASKAVNSLANEMLKECRRLLDENKKL